YKVKTVNHRIPPKKALCVINNSKVINQELKPYLSEQEMIKKISKDIFLTNSDTILLEKFLKKNSYFRFSIYVKLMKNIDKVTILDVIETYKLDSFIRNQLHYFVNQIEIFWKKSLSDNMCVSYEETSIFPKNQCYLDKNIYSDLKWAEDIIGHFNSFFYSNQSPTFKHHHIKKNHCLPIWALFEEITFGSLTTFINQLNTEYYNNWVMSCYDNPKYKKAIRSWANVIRAYRNKIAHHSRIYAFKVTDAPTIIKNDSKSYFPENNLKETQKLYLYGGLYVIKHLLIYEDSMTQTLWNKFLIDLEKKIDKIPSLEKSNYGFPENWRNKLKIMIV
ncbi:TPA: Abi family protein, partial [Enterococcus faecium]|nr:Abi family protein [Enterococcus faecium]